MDKKQLVDALCAGELSISRFEVIDHRSDAETFGRRVIVPRSERTCRVFADVQNDGRTLKLFLSDPPDDAAQS